MYLKISNDIFGHKILSSKEKLQIYKFSNLNIFLYLYTEPFIFRKSIYSLLMAMPLPSLLNKTLFMKCLFLKERLIKSKNVQYRPTLSDCTY